MIYCTLYLNKTNYNLSTRDQNCHTPLSWPYMLQMIALSAVNTRLQVTPHCPTQFKDKEGLLKTPPPASHTPYKRLSHSQLGEHMSRGRGWLGILAAIIMSYFTLLLRFGTCKNKVLYIKRKGF